MNPVIVRDVKIGEGIPKICIPIVGKNKEEILEMAANIVALPADLVEWRADWYDDICDHEKMQQMLQELRKVLGDMPLLFTVRTANEGGQKELNETEYVELNKKAIATKCIDILDVEVFGYEKSVKDLVEYAHSYGTKVIGSNHDFYKTPCEAEIIARLLFMQELGADILKIAVMPETKKDVLALLSATEKMANEYAKKPVVTMSMSKEGVVSRIVGETFGSAITFGTAGTASAPGQISAIELKKILEIIHGENIDK